MLKIPSYTKEQFEPVLQQRLAYAMSERKNRVEEQWVINEQLFYDALGGVTDYTSVNIRAVLEELEEEVETKTSKPIAINYIFKYVRYLLSQMSANPPALVVRPASPELSDKRKADVADYASRYVKKKHEMQEVVDLRNLRTLTKGIGFIKVAWDPHKGEIEDFDKETRELLLEGDTDIYSPSNWDIYPNPDAVAGRPLGWFFEKLTFTKEEALARWPEHERLIEEAFKAHKPKPWKRFWSKGRAASSEDKIEVFEYWEEGEPLNAYEGRFCYCLESGKILGELSESPSPDGKLPLDWLTDIDVEDDFWGKSVIEYMEAIQAILNDIDEADLANIEAHHVVRMAINKAETNLADDALTDDAKDVIEYEGELPHFIQAPGTMPDVPRFRQTLHEGQKDMAGVNDEMMGRMNRETSGFTFQTAINAGNMIRTRLYNKYAKSVKNIYLLALLNMRDYWKKPRQIAWLGDEKAYMVMDLCGIDLADGWDLDAEYGNNFSLNPDIAREQIMQMIPIYEKIEGFDWASLADKVVYGDIGGVEDKYKLAARRQEEIFRKMITRFEEKGISAYIEPRKNADHENMLKFCDYYVMTGEYARLDDDLKDLIDKHIEDLIRVQAEKVAAAQPPPQGPAAAPAAPMPGPLPAGIPGI